MLTCGRCADCRMQYIARQARSQPHRTIASTSPKSWLKAVSPTQSSVRRWVWMATLVAKGPGCEVNVPATRSELQGKRKRGMTARWACPTLSGVPTASRTLPLRNRAFQTASSDQHVFLQRQNGQAHRSTTTSPKLRSRSAERKGGLRALVGQATTTTCQSGSMGARVQSPYDQHSQINCKETRKPVQQRPAPGCRLHRTHGAPAQLAVAAVVVALRAQQPLAVRDPGVNVGQVCTAGGLRR